MGLFPLKRTLQVNFYFLFENQWGMKRCKRPWPWPWLVLLCFKFNFGNYNMYIYIYRCYSVKWPCDCKIHTKKKKKFGNPNDKNWKGKFRSCAVILTSKVQTCFSGITSICLIILWGWGQNPRHVALIWHGTILQLNIILKSPTLRCNCRIQSTLAHTC